MAPFVTYAYDRLDGKYFIKMDINCEFFECKVFHEVWLEVFRICVCQKSAKTDHKYWKQSVITVVMIKTLPY